MTSTNSSGMFSGHPKGLYRLFFIEMWERLAFYTMVGILLLYCLDRESGGLGMRRDVGNEIYGLYLAFVYFTPYLGGLLADRFLGYRKAVLIGGLFFAAGFFQLAMGKDWSFVSGLVCLCVGNGFFKPNISAMVGNLYQPGDPKRDAGFNIFYMGINIGAFVANFLAAIMRNEIGWLAIFVAAGCGMLIGIAILLASWRVLERADRQPGARPGDTPFSQILGKIIGPALLVGVAGYFVAEHWLPAGVTRLVKPSDIGFLVGAIPIILFFVRLSNRAEAEEKPGLLALLPIYVAGGTFFMVLHLNGSAMTTWAKDQTDRKLGSADPVVLVAGAMKWFAGEAYPGYYGNALPDDPRPDQRTLLKIADEAEATMFGQKRMDQTTLAALRARLPDHVRVESLPRSGDLTEQQKAWRKYAVDVYAEVEVKQGTDSHGLPTVSVEVSDTAPVLDRVAFVRTAGDEQFAAYLVTAEKFEQLYAGNPPELPPGQFLRTANAELYQSWNALFVVLMTPLVMMFFGWLLARGRDFSTARKIVAGMVITALSALFMALAGVASGNGAVKVSGLWLMGFYAIVTVGELFLSPMALSLVTKLSPKRFVGLTMGGWFFATAVGNKFSGFLGGLQGQMTPTAFFLVIAGAVSLVALGLYLLLPRLDAAIKRYGA